MSTRTDRAAIYEQIELLRARQILSGYTAEYDADNASSLWRSERQIQEVRADVTGRSPAVRRRALLKIAALAVAQIEAIDARRG